MTDAPVAEDGSRSAAAAPAPSRSRGPGRDGLAGALLGAAALVWAVPLTHASGGRDGAGTPVLAVLLLAALSALGVRAVRARCGTVLLALAGWTAAAALLVPVLTATAWRTSDALGWVDAGLAVVALRTWAGSPARRAVVLAVVATAGLEQVTQGLLPWWGRGLPDVPMVGTFYWWNQFAAFCAAAALAGLGLLVWRVRPWHLLGWAVAPLGAACVVLSTSRATLALLAAGWCAVGLLAARAARRPLARLGAASLVAAAVTLVLPGPPLFPRWHSPLGGAAARGASGGSVGTNGHYRTEFWREALTVWRQHPVTGAGYHHLATASQGHVPAGWALSPYAHDGVLQALAEGGALLGVPVALAALLLLGCAARGALDGLRAPTAEPLAAVAAVATGLLLVHSLVDTDGSYPSLAVLLGALAGTCLAAPRRTRDVEGVAP